MATPASYDDSKLLGQTEKIEIKNISNDKFDQTKVKHEPITAVPNSFILQNILTQDECATIVEQLWIGSKDAGIHPVLFRQWSENREEEEKKLGSRIIKRSPEFSALLFERVKKYLPQTWISQDSKSEQTTWAIQGLSERHRFVKYDKNQYFPPHFDGAEVKNEGKTRSFLTILFYLDQAGTSIFSGNDFRGGALNFLEKAPPGQTPKKLHSVLPATGLCVVFPHITLHEGESLKSGHKYLIRCDVLYNKVSTQTTAPTSNGATTSTTPTPTQTDTTTTPSEQPTQQEEFH